MSQSHCVRTCIMNQSQCVMIGIKTQSHSVKIDIMTKKMQGKRLYFGNITLCEYIYYDLSTKPRLGIET